MNKVLAETGFEPVLSGQNARVLTTTPGIFLLEKDIWFSKDSYAAKQSKFSWSKQNKAKYDVLNKFISQYPREP